MDTLHAERAGSRFDAFYGIMDLTNLEDPIWDKLQQSTEYCMIFRDCSETLHTQELLEGCPTYNVPLAVHVPMNPEEIVPEVLEGAFAGVPRLRCVQGAALLALRPATLALQFGQNFCIWIGRRPFGPDCHPAVLARKLLPDWVCVGGLQFFFHEYGRHVGGVPRSSLKGKETQHDEGKRTQATPNQPQHQTCGRPAKVLEGHRHSYVPTTM